MQAQADGLVAGLEALRHGVDGKVRIARDKVSVGALDRLHEEAALEQVELATNRSPGIFTEPLGLAIHRDPGRGVRRVTEEALAALGLGAEQDPACWRPAWKAVQLTAAPTHYAARGVRQAAKLQDTYI